jgi:hypothetical protein
MGSGSGLIINGKPKLVPGLDITNWLDNPVLRLRKGEDCTDRAPGTWIRIIVLHTTKGLAGGPPMPGIGPSVKAGERTARFWSGDGRQAGTHLVVDHDGKVFCLADIVAETAYHCPKWNTCSVGIELYQGASGELYEGQFDACVRLLDVLTAELRIQRQIPHRYIGPIDRFVAGDATAVGVIGHRDAARNRGSGDPGNAIFNRLGLAGYEPVDYDQRMDLAEWRKRQAKLGMAVADGIAGPKTADVLEAAGRPHGLWVTRPGDQASLPGFTS